MNETEERSLTARLLSYSTYDRKCLWSKNIMPQVRTKVHESALFFRQLEFAPSFVLWHCWLGGRKGIRPVKNWVMGSGMGICLGQGADLHMAQLMPLPPTVSCFSKIQIGFTFLVPAHPGSPGQRAVKWVLLLCCCWNLLHESAYSVNNMSNFKWLLYTSLFTFASSTTELLQWFRH